MWAWARQWRMGRLMDEKGKKRERTAMRRVANVAGSTRRGPAHKGPASAAVQAREANSHDISFAAYITGLLFPCKSLLNSEKFLTECSSPSSSRVCRLFIPGSCRHHTVGVISRRRQGPWRMAHWPISISKRDVARRMVQHSSAQLHPPLTYSNTGRRNQISSSVHRDELLTFQMIPPVAVFWRGFE